MKLWKVEFQGYWPVGAVAIARATNEYSARMAAYRALPDDLKATNDADTSDMKATEIKVPENGAVILLDGEY